MTNETNNPKPRSPKSFTEEQVIDMTDKLMKMFPTDKYRYVVVVIDQEGHQNILGNGGLQFSVQELLRAALDMTPENTTEIPDYKPKV